MKLLFDQNLSFRLAAALDDLFPGSSQVRLLSLDRADDGEIWRVAGEQGFALVSQDADFAELAALHGPPPKVVWLRCGNQPTGYVADLLREHASQLLAFNQADDLDCLEIAYRG